MELARFLEDLKILVNAQSPTEDLAANNEVVEIARNIVLKILPQINCKINTVEGRPTLLIGNSQPKILFLTHLDTVWPKNSFENNWVEDNNKIFGPGIFDMKTGFLQSIYSIKNLIDSGLNHSDIAVLATTDEETGSFASKNLIAELSSKAKYVLVPESGIENSIKIGRKGTAMYKIKVFGSAAHAGLEPEKGVNALVAAAELILKIDQLWQRDTDTSVVPTIAKAGTTSNSVPEYAEIEIDVRSFELDNLQKIDRAVKSLTSTLTGIKIEVEGGINRPPFSPSKSENLFKILNQALLNKNLPTVSGVSVGGASDGNFAAQYCENVLDGIGAVGQGAHARNEHILVNEIEPRIQLITTLLEELING